MWVAPAEADHHEMKVSEVFAGSENTSFVELQMDSSGQRFVDGHQIVLYGSTGTATHTFTFPDDVDLGANQSTILVGDSDALGTPDFTDSELFVPSAGGGACFISTEGFGPIDCVNWGNFTGSTPSGSGSPVAPSGITPGQSITRTIARGCSTLLDSPDDTGQSVNDFAQTAPTPRSNAVTPTEAACVNTSITKAPKKKGKDRTPTIEFTSSPVSNEYECRVDDDPFAPCSSPHTTPKLKRGKHAIEVRGLGAGAAGADPTPAKASFKIIKK
jgi:hypothetical protein